MTELTSQSSRAIVLSEIPQQEINHPTHKHFKSLQQCIQIKDISFDRSGQLWGAGNGGVVRWHMSSLGVQYRIWQSEHGLADNDVTCLYVSNDVVLCGHRSGNISIIRNNKAELISTEIGMPIRSCLIDVDNNLLVGGDFGIFNFTLDLAVQTPGPVLTMTVYDGCLWFGTDRGLWERKEFGWEEFVFNKNTGPVSYLAVSGANLWEAVLESCTSSECE